MVYDHEISQALDNLEILVENHRFRYQYFTELGNQHPIRITLVGRIITKEYVPWPQEVQVSFEVEAIEQATKTITKKYTLLSSDNWHNSC